MNKAKIREIVHSTQHKVLKYTPEILTGVGIAGMITTTVLAVKATPKALQLIEEEKQLQNEKLTLEAKQIKHDNCVRINKLKLTDVVKVTWRCYLPAVITGFASTACLIGASSVHVKRNAALATVYKIAETARSEYRDAVIETIGEKKEQLVKDKLAEKHIKENPVNNNTVIITPKGDTLCYDHISGRYFRSSVDAINKAENAMNRKLLAYDYASLNELYLELGLEPLNVVGNDLGWNVCRLPDRTLKIEFSAVLSEDDTPCLSLEYNIAPYYNFDIYE